MTAFSAPAARANEWSWRQFYIDRSFYDEDTDETVERIAKSEGYRIVRYETKESPDFMKSGKTLKTVRIIVEPAYSGRTGVPGCCGPNAMPDHYPNPSCRSGKRPHCTCDGCF